MPLIESHYNTLTPSEKAVADYFISTTGAVNKDLSARTVAAELHISESSLTRFAKKCGFTGYREFIYTFKNESTNREDGFDKEIEYKDLTNAVIKNYTGILEDTFSLIDEEAIENVIEMVIEAKRVHLYGIGSSGLVAEELRSRLMRLGIQCDVITDHDLLLMSLAVTTADSVVIAFSLSSKTKEILEALEEAHNNGAKTVLFTANARQELNVFVDEIILVANRKELNHGTKISPQFPLLVMVDIFYTYLLNNDINSRGKIFLSTLEAIQEKENNGESGNG